MAFKVVIPARYGSTRLPAKAIADIAGRPMIQWVADAAIASGAEQVIVATDDVRVADAIAHDSGVTVAMTRAEHPSGTDRIAEVALANGWAPTTIIVNVQGDEPLLPPVLIRQVAALLATDPRADIATLSTPIATIDEFLDPNAVKVVRASDGAALYFSRAPIPWTRDGALYGITSQTIFSGAQRHLGIYAYRVASLLRMTAMQPSTLEMTEKLEQLRALEGGMRIVVATASERAGIGVDTQHDLERVRSIVASRKP